MQKKDLENIWCQVLDIESCPEDIPFLELGGDSLLAGELVMRINEKFNKNIHIITIFEHNTINKLFAEINR